MSVWESLEALADFVYRSDHLAVMRRRREFFERMAEAFIVLWWVPAGHRPSAAEAKDRLARLRRDGPSQEAFTFRSPFPAPDDTTTGAPAVDDRWGCPTG
jgi:Domain of unknown function (DUF3291)